MADLDQLLEMMPTRPEMTDRYHPIEFAWKSWDTLHGLLVYLRNKEEAEYHDRMERRERTEYF